MAKSIRSKHRRQMRNIKRQHYAKRDLERLKRLAVKSSELKDIVTMKSVEEIKEIKEQAVDQGQPADSTMEVEKVAKVYDKKTLQDENGHYPDWMNKRAVRKQRQKLKMIKIKKRVGKATKKLKW